MVELSAGQISNAYTAAAESVNAAVAGCWFDAAYVEMLG